MNQTFGNFEEGYNLVAARPSVGKTSFVLQLMVYWWQCGYKCAFNCLDMACSQIIKRPTMNLAQLNLTRANRGMLTEEEFKRLKQAAATIKKWDEDGIIKFREDYDVDKFIAWCKLQKSMAKATRTRSLLRFPSDLRTSPTRTRCRLSFSRSFLATMSRIKTESASRVSKTSEGLGHSNRMPLPSLYSIVIKHVKQRCETQLILTA